MINNILAFVRLEPLAIFLFVAIAGPFAALIGGLAGWADVTEFGKLAAGGGALSSDFNSGVLGHKETK